MIRNRCYMFFLGLFITALTGCEAIFEKNISGRKPLILTPFDGSAWEEGSVAIKWEKIDGAVDYELQLVSPDFNQTNYYLLDCTYVSNEVITELQQGEYAVRVRANNSAYKSKWSDVTDFTVGDVGVSEQVKLLEPYNNAWYNNNFFGLFKWENVAGAQSYVFSLRVGEDFESGDVIFQTQITSTDFTYNSLPYYSSNDSFFWGVAAIVDGTLTDFSSRVINIDVTQPGLPSLVSPVNNLIWAANNNLIFEWENYTDVDSFESEIRATIQVATDTNFNNLVGFHYGPNESYQMPLPSSGDYYWRVMNRDEAGNFGPYTTYRKFTIP